MDEIIKNYYYDVNTGYVSANKLYQKMKDDKYNVTRKQIKEFYDNQAVVQKTKMHPLKADRVYNSIVASQYGSNYQIDIIVYDRFEFHKYKYILCCVDVYSRYASCRAMTNRRNETILDEIKSIFDEMGTPKAINADNEFNKSVFNKYFNDNDIVCYFSQPAEINKSAIVERFNRTLTQLINKWRLSTGRYDWYKTLNDIVKNYNNTYHRTIKTKPIKIKDGDDINRQNIVRVSHDFEIGDKVRVMQEQNIFSKGDVVYWSDEIYDVTGIDGNKVYITDHDVYFKPYELMKINGDVGAFDNQELEHETIHVALKKTKKIDKELKQVGIDQKYDLGDSKRIKKPSYKLLNQ